MEILSTTKLTNERWVNLFVRTFRHDGHVPIAHGGHSGTLEKNLDGGAHIRCWLGPRSLALGK